MKHSTHAQRFVLMAIIVWYGVAHEGGAKVNKYELRVTRGTMVG